MENILFKTDFYIADNDNRILHHLVIHEPMLTEEGDSACVVSIAPLLTNEKQIIGLDQGVRTLEIEC